jgi:hypothetical protein
MGRLLATVTKAVRKRKGPMSKTSSFFVAEEKIIKKKETWLSSRNERMREREGSPE